MCPRVLYVHRKSQDTTRTADSSSELRLHEHRFRGIFPYPARGKWDDTGAVALHHPGLGLGKALRLPQLARWPPIQIHQLANIVVRVDREVRLGVFPLSTAGGRRVGYIFVRVAESTRTRHHAARDWHSRLGLESDGSSSSWSRGCQCRSSRSAWFEWVAWVACVGHCRSRMGSQGPSC